MYRKKWMDVWSSFMCVWSCLWCQDHAGICCMLTLKTACQKWRLLTFSEIFYRRSIIYTTEALFTGKYAVGESWVIYQCRSWITVIAIAVIARIGEPFKGSNVPFMSHFVNEWMIMKASLPLHRASVHTEHYGHYTPLRYTLKISVKPVFMPRCVRYCHLHDEPVTHCLCTVTLTGALRDRKLPTYFSCHGICPWCPCIYQCDSDDWHPL